MKWFIIIGSVLASDTSELFPKEADLFLSSSGLTRLDLPAEILEQCRADLSDLRIFDLEGREVPFLLDQHPSASALVKTAQVKPLRAKQEKFNHDKREPKTWRETYTVPVPDGAPEGQTWELVLDARAPQFVRRVEMADAKQSVLVKDGSVFRLPSMGTERTRIALPPLKTSSITIVISGQEQFYLEPRFRFESSRRFGDERGIVIVALAELSRKRDRGRTIIELQRPRGVVPRALRVQTSSQVFNRQVDVYDFGGPSAPADPNRLASGTIFRVVGEVPVENTEIALPPARGDRLRVEITDGDSPELSSLQFSAVLPRPALIFDLASTGPDKPSGVLRFGGGRARAPRYDLAGLLPAHGTAVGDRAQVAANLSAPSLGSARLGTIRDSASYYAKPALAFAMRPGAEADARLYSHRREITVGDAREGLSRVSLEASDLAVLRSDLADIRIVDAQLRQWPYLIEPRATFGWAVLPTVTVERKGTTSRLRVQVPSVPFLFDLLELNISSPYFDRSFKLLGTDESKSERVLAVGRLSRGADEPLAALTIPVAETRVTSLELQIDNGNDAPLELLGLRARMPQPEMYLVAPPGKYSLVLGNSEDVAPSYEIGHVRSLILSVSSASATVGPLLANPQFQRSARLASSGGVERVILWAILGLSVVVLLVITFRIAQRGKVPPKAI